MLCPYNKLYISIDRSRRALLFTIIKLCLNYLSSKVIWLRSWPFPKMWFFKYVFSLVNLNILMCWKKSAFKRCINAQNIESFSCVLREIFCVKKKNCFNIFWTGNDISLFKSDLESVKKGDFFHVNINILLKKKSCGT